MKDEERVNKENSQMKMAYTARNIKACKHKY